MRTVVGAALQNPGLAGPVASSYEDYSVTKDTEEKLIEVR